MDNLHKFKQILFELMNILKKLLGEVEFVILIKCILTIFSLFEPRFSQNGKNRSLNVGLVPTTLRL